MSRYLDIPEPGPAYRAAAALALAEGICPDCGRPIQTTPARYDDGVVGLLECGSCDTVWSTREGAPEGFEWWRTQRTASVLHMGTGRHPILATIEAALLAAGFALEDMPALVSAPMAAFPYTDDEADRFDRNGCLTFMPPTGTNHPTRPRHEGLDMGPALRAAYDAGEKPYGTAHAPAAEAAHDAAG